MAITGKLICVSASTVTTFPITQAGLPTDPPTLSFLPSQFDAYLGFQKRFQDWLDGYTGRIFGLLLHRLQASLAFLPL
jgi:hypothetical protein